MKLSVSYQPGVAASASPYRVCDEKGGEVVWANAFLDAQHLRQLSPRSLRIYAYDLLDFARWLAPLNRPLAEITESTIVDYVRHQLDAQTADGEPSPRHRALLLSLPHRARDSRRPSAFPAPLYPQIPARLRPAAPGRSPGPPP